MQVSFNPSYNYNSISFGKKQEKQEPVKDYTEKEIRIAKTKKAISECATIVVGVGILYFAMKRNFKINKIKSHERKLKEISGMELPKIKLNSSVKGADSFIKV